MPRTVVGSAATAPGAAGELGVARASSERWAPALATLLALLLVAATAEIVLDGALGHSPLIPKSPEIAGWLRASASAWATASS